MFDSASLPFWHLITRLGEAQTVLPAALLAGFELHRQTHTRVLALWWMALLATAITLTTASKLAFIGWGIGWPALDFTGISGHAMFASAVYPLLFGTVLAPRLPPAGRHVALFAGCVLALLVGMSRVVIGVHSVSEVLAGLLVGGAVSALVLGIARLPRVLIGPVVPAVVVLFVALMPAHAPASLAHPAVTRLALILSGSKAPFTRAGMLRKLHAPDTV